MADESTTPNKTAKAKDKVVKPETESAVKDAVAAVTGTARKAGSAASEGAKAATGSVSQAASDVSAEAKAQGAQVLDQANSKVAEVRAQAEDRARAEAEKRKAQASGALSTTAQDLRRASGAVEESWLTKAFATAAEALEDVTRGLDNRSPQELQRTVANAARNNPGLFLAGCFAAGVALSRTLKVAAERSPDHLYDDPERGYGDASYGAYGQDRDYQDRGYEGRSYQDRAYDDAAPYDDASDTLGSNAAPYGAGTDLNR